MTTLKENILEAENSALRELVAQAGLDASRLLEQAGIKATERDAAERLQRLLLEELHHRVKNTLATVMAIASQSLRNATDLEQGRKSISHRLIALGRAHDLLEAKAALGVVVAPEQAFEHGEHLGRYPVAVGLSLGPVAR